MGTPVTQDDHDSVKDVTIEEALAYLELLERERRGLLKVRVIFRGVQRSQIQQRDAEREVARLAGENATATAALQELLARVAGEQARLDGLVAEVGETERRLNAARLAADEEEAAIEQRLKQRRTDADRALGELDRASRERREALEAELLAIQTSASCRRRIDARSCAGAL